MPAEKSFALGALVLLAASTTASAVEFSNSVFTSRWNAQGNEVTTTVNNTVTINSATLGSAPAPPPPLPATPTINPVSVNSATLGPATTPMAAPAAAADAFLNFGNAPYSEAGTLTTGTPGAWYLSPAVQALYGGTPNAQQQQQFTSAVLKDVVQTYQASGLKLNLTTDPNATAAHSLSVVSGASYAANSQAIGITDVGNSGFSFIDKFGVPNSADQLEWAVAHNISHELMHAFGVGTHHDQTGTYLDAAITPWSLLMDPNARLSPAAVSDLQTHKWDVNSNGSSTYGAEYAGSLTGAEIASQPVPEPGTVAFWGLAALAMTAKVRRRRAA